jgi:hypothetical protein
MTQPLIGGAGRILCPRRNNCLVPLPEPHFLFAPRGSPVQGCAPGQGVDLSNIFLATFNSIATPSMTEGR